jgi:hypothetical protein
MQLGGTGSSARDIRAAFDEYEAFGECDDSDVLAG